MVKNNSPLISVIIPTYNEEHTIISTIKHTVKTADCAVNVVDAAEAQRAGLPVPMPPITPTFDIDFCDINQDGACNVIDSAEMQRAGLPVPLPPISPNFDVTGCTGYLGP